MYPTRFRYEAPKTLDEALALLAQHGDDAKIIAGGQSLVPMMKLRFAAPSVLIDINGIPRLDYHEEETDGSLSIGALCRHADLEHSTLLPGRHPTLAAVAPLVADPIVRNRGTLVGSLCHADPQGDWASALLALGGSIVALGPRGTRTIPVAEFVVGTFENALAPGEIAVEAVVPPARGTRQGGYLKLERRIGDFATAGVAIALEVTGGKVERAGIALTGVGPTTIQATEAERALTGSSLGASAIARAAELAASAARPRTDHRGTEQYKRHVIATFVRRLLSADRMPVAA